MLSLGSSLYRQIGNHNLDKPVWQSSLAYWHTQETRHYKFMSAMLIHLNHSFQRVHLENQGLSLCLRFILGLILSHHCVTVTVLVVLLTMKNNPLDSEFVSSLDPLSSLSLAYIYILISFYILP